MGKEYERKVKGDKPVVAICYDFDKTLSPDDMQAQGYIQSVGYDIKEFWEESNTLAEENDMDQNLSYMYLMVKEAEGKLVFTRENLADYGSKVALFPGVENWFERIKKYGEKYDVIVEHYIISSGLKEMIEGTRMAKDGAFTKIYASSFYFNDKGVAKWPAQVINYTNKTQFLFRIEKGVLDINDQGVNEFFPSDKMRVPFRNLVYIGDSDTDIPCMKLVNSYGGYAIGVYNPDTEDKTKVYKMVRDNRIKMFAAADYTDGSELDGIVKGIIKRTASNEVLVDMSNKYIEEVRRFDFNKGNDKEQNKKEELISCLEMSSTFTYTHQTIAKLRRYKDWSSEEINRLLDIALNNDQVQWILTDSDVKVFYEQIIKKAGKNNSTANDVKKYMNN